MLRRRKGKSPPTGLPRARFGRGRATARRAARALVAAPSSAWPKSTASRSRRSRAAAGRAASRRKDVLAYVERQAQTGQGGQQPLAGRDRVEPMSPMRKKIAEHMVLSRRTSAHVHSVFEVATSPRVAQARDARQAEYDAIGREAHIPALRRQGGRQRAPGGSARERVDRRGEHRLSPRHQCRHCGGARMGIDRAGHQRRRRCEPGGAHAPPRDCRSRGRGGAKSQASCSSPKKVGGGTFTITNPGAFGSPLLGCSIINQPQVAILAVASSRSVPVVRDDSIVIRLMGYMALGYDPARRWRRGRRLRRLEVKEHYSSNALGSRIELTMRPLEVRRSSASVAAEEALALQRDARRGSPRRPLRRPSFCSSNIHTSSRWGVKIPTAGPTRTFWHSSDELQTREGGAPRDGPRGRHHHHLPRAGTAGRLPDPRPEPRSERDVHRYVRDLEEVIIRATFGSWNCPEGEFRG